MLHGIQLICFDLDDTLWPCMPTIHYAEEQYYLWLKQNKSLITDTYSITGLREKRKLLRDRSPELAHDMSKLRIQSLLELAEEFGYSTEWIDEAFDIFYQARQQVKVFDDVIPVLEQLKPHYKLATATNGNADVYRTELADYVDYAVSAAEAGSSKPDPAMFELLQQKSGLSAEAILHIGDHPTDDIEGAGRAGIRSVWVNRNKQHWQHTGHKPDYEIENLYELLPSD